MCEDDETKYCSKCDKTRSICCFSKNQSWCKDCHKKYKDDLASGEDPRERRYRERKNKRENQGIMARRNYQLGVSSRMMSLASRLSIMAEILEQAYIDRRLPTNDEAFEKYQLGRNEYVAMKRIFSQPVGKGGHPPEFSYVELEDVAPELRVLLEKNWGRYPNW